MTMATLTATMMPFTFADSSVPLISRSRQDQQDQQRGQR